MMLTLQNGFSRANLENKLRKQIKLVTFLLLLVPSCYELVSYNAPYYTSGSVMSLINYVKAVTQMDLINCLPSPP